MATKTAVKQQVKGSPVMLALLELGFPQKTPNVGQILGWLKENGHARPPSTNLFVEVQLGQKRLRELLDS